MNDTTPDFVEQEKRRREAQAKSAERMIYFGVFAFIVMVLGGFIFAVLRFMFVVYAVLHFIKKFW